MLKVFLGKIKAPTYKLVPPPDGELQTINVDKEV